MIRTTRYTVAPKGEPIFSDQSAHIEIVDEVAGEFLVIKQDYDEQEHVVKFNFEEWAEIDKAVKMIMAASKKNEKAENRTA